MSAGGYGNGQVHRPPFHSQTQILQTEQDMCRVSFKAAQRGQLKAIKTLRYQLSVIYFFNGYFNNLLKVIQKNPNKTYAIKDCVAFTELIVHDLGAFNKILICHIMCLFLCRPTHSPAPMRRRPTWTHRLSLVCWQAFVCFEVIWYSYLILPLVNIKGTRMEDRGGTQKRPQLATWSALPLREALNRPEYRHTD